jgi:hypothetical protein
VANRPLSDAVFTASIVLRVLFGAVIPNTGDVPYFSSVILPEDMKAILIFVGRRGVSAFHRHQEEAEK